MNEQQLASLNRIPEVEVKAWIHPQKISVRTRNYMIATLRSGVPKYSWSSKATKLLNFLCNTYNIPLFKGYGDTVYIPPYIYTHAKTEVHEALTVAHAKALLRDEGNYSASVSYRIRHHKGLSQWDPSVQIRRYAEYVYIDCIDMACRNQIAEICTLHRNKDPDTVARVENMVARLQGTEPIPVNPG